MEPSFEEQLLQRITNLDNKLDEVRTKTIPAIKTDIAVLINDNKAQSKLHSFIGSIAAIVIGALLPHR